MRLILFLFFIFSSSIIFAQRVSYISHVYAFYTLRMPGNIMKDASGNPITPKLEIINLIYLEIDTSTYKNIKWGKAYKNNEVYDITPIPVTEFPITLTPVDGSNNPIDSAINISPSDGHMILQLDISPTTDSVSSSKKQVEPNQILIEGKNKCKKFRIKIEKQIRVQSFNAP